ncbi:MAG: LysR family transcriptional regulator [Oscillospiraceae bacterium]|nr:LysR family transcriptional regulator [Oscillospiraceae bacterium]
MLDYRVNTFLTLYEEMNYHKTAEKLNMTQPGVTQHIRVLEQYYGVKLFVYDGRTLSRTKYADHLKRYFDSVRSEETHLRGSFVPKDTIHLAVGATKTIGEYVVVPEIRAFVKSPNHTLDLTIDNTANLLQMLEQSKLDFAVIEGVFDKSRYGYHLYKKETFVGVCAKTHPFANKTVTLEDVFEEDIVVREPFSGTRKLLEQAIADRGFSLENFRRCSSVSHFSMICDLVANQNMITFAYTPVAKSREDLTTFTVSDMHISGEFNFVYCNERIAREKISKIFE